MAVTMRWHAGDSGCICDQGSGKLIASGKQVFGIPIDLVGNAVSQVHPCETPTLARDNPRGLTSMFKRASLWLTLIASVPIGSTAWLAPWLFTVIFGQGWDEAGVYVLKYWA
jgi:O-antigen/teichoic acid export membrane protein